METKPSIHRIKGRVFTTNGAVKMIQGVREVFEMVDLEQNGSEVKVGSGVATRGKMVLIGREMDERAYVVSLSFQLEKMVGDDGKDE